MMNRRILLLGMMAIVAAVPWGLLAAEEAQRDADSPSGRADRDRQDRPRRDPQRNNLSDEQETELLTFLRKHRPEVASQIEELKDTNPRRYRAAMGLAWWHYRHLRSMPEEIQDAYIEEGKAKIQIYRLAMAYRQAEESEKKQALQEQLAKAVGTQFDLEQKVREYRLKRLEEHLNRLKEELQARRENRKTLIQERIERILTEGPPRPEDDRPPHPPGGPPQEKGR